MDWRVFRIKVVLVAVAVVIVAFIFGHGVGKLTGSVGTLPVFTGLDLLGVGEGRAPADFKEDFTLFWKALDVVRDKYLRIHDVEDKDFLYGAIKGAVGSLDDPYTVFLEPNDAEKFDQDIQGKFGGIGAEIGIKDGGLVVIAPLKGNPAERAGLEAGDRILKVGETSMDNISVEKAVMLIRGEVGTEVILLIGRDGWEKPKEFPITREVITVPTLEWNMVSAKPGGDNDVFYVKLFNFNGLTLQEFSEAAFSALFKGTNGIVLDLRNNPGGFLDVAWDVAGWFIQKGDVVVGQKGRDGTIEELRARGNSALQMLPVAVLVNGGSASASEILAGALRDLRGAKLIGEKTFGKGSVQELEELPDGSTLKVTTAEWITPLGASIDRVGLEPDVLVEADPETEEDEQLQRALEVIAPQLSGSRAVPQIIF